jgi:hypothetical protein
MNVKHKAHVSQGFTQFIRTFFIDADETVVSGFGEGLKNF